MQDPNIKICLPPVSNQDWQASFLEYITSTIFKTGRILKENKKWKLRKLEKVGCATTGLLFKKLAWVSGSMPVETLLRFSRKRVLHNLWVRQVVISWLDRSSDDTSWWWPTPWNFWFKWSISAPPSSSFTCQILTVSIIILFCLKCD